MRSGGTFPASAPTTVEPDSDPLADPVITYERRPAPALHFLVTFGLFSGRGVTRLEIRRLAEALLTLLPAATIFSEERFEVGPHSQADLHEVRVEVGHEALPCDETDVEALRARIAELIRQWARSCMTAVSGAELTELELAARDAVL